MFPVPRPPKLFWIALIVTFVIAFVISEVPFKYGLITQTESDIFFLITNAEVIFPLYSWIEKRCANARPSRYLPKPITKFLRFMLIALVVIAMILGIIVLGLT